VQPSLCPPVWIRALLGTRLTVILAERRPAAIGDGHGMGYSALLHPNHFS